MLPFLLTSVHSCGCLAAVCTEYAHINSVQVAALQHSCQRAGLLSLIFFLLFGGILYQDNVGTKSQCQCIGSLESSMDLLLVDFLQLLADANVNTQAFQQKTLGSPSEHLPCLSGCPGVVEV